MYSKQANEIVKILGGSWKCVLEDKSWNRGTVFLTKHNVTFKEVRELRWGLAMTVEICKSNYSQCVKVNAINLHLNFVSYGPYAAQYKMVNTSEILMHGEDSSDGRGRKANIMNLLKSHVFKLFNDQVAHVPMVVLGDFNSPSHLDWVNETRHLHGGWVFEWPATKLLTEVGLVDSFRMLHPDILKEPGYTWSPVHKKFTSEWNNLIDEPQDRVDFIFNKGDIKPIGSFAYCGRSNDTINPIPHHVGNTYPSDHCALITDFETPIMDYEKNLQTSDLDNDHEKKTD